MPTPLSKAENTKLKAAEGVFVHLPVASEEDRQIFAGNVLTAVRAARPTRVVFSTSGFPIDPAVGGAAATLATSLADSRVSPVVIELYLENLLMPYVTDSVRERGILLHHPARFRRRPVRTPGRHRCGLRPTVPGDHGAGPCGVVRRPDGPERALRADRL
ncbi:hypothetical protein ABTZ93_42390 [Streptomyces sp. NPDC097941]|uniref:hypothetical protein n=1 Tax=Streptomyces sp. NPDC097941 TaxID=3155685 RepID=UPI003323BD8F